jgi:hypothetical protein
VPLTSRKRNETNLPLTIWLAHFEFLFFFHPVPFGSSSVQIAGAAKSLDMTMPSYGTISATKISSDDFASLSVAPVKEVKSPAKSKSKSEPESESGFSFPALLPSMNKKGPEDAAAEKAEKKAAAAEKAEKKAVVKKAAVPKVKTPEYDF